MKTTLEKLREEIYPIIYNNNDVESIYISNVIFEKYLKTEKQQIIDLCTEAYELGLAHKEYSAEEIYKLLFKK